MIGIYVKEIEEMYMQRRRDGGKYKLPGEAPFCGSFKKCMVTGRASCVKCKEFIDFVSGEKK